MWLSRTVPTKVTTAPSPLVSTARTRSSTDRGPSVTSKRVRAGIATLILHLRPLCSPSSSPAYGRKESYLVSIVDCLLGISVRAIEREGGRASVRRETRVETSHARPHVAELRPRLYYQGGLRCTRCFAQGRK